MPTKTKRHMQYNYIPRIGGFKVRSNENWNN